MKVTYKKATALVLCIFLFMLNMYAAIGSGASTQDVPEQQQETVQANLDREKSITIPSAEDRASTDYYPAQNTGSAVWTTIIVLAFICLLIWLIGWFFKSRMAPGAEPDMYLKKTAQLTLSPGKTVQVVTLRERAYVLGVSEAGVTLIDSIDGTDSETGHTSDKELIDDMNLNAQKNLTEKPKDFAAMLSALTQSSKRTEDFIKKRRQSFRGSDEGR